MIGTTLVVTSLVCLAFSFTRAIGVLGLAILFLLHPLLFLVLLLSWGVALIYLYLQKRS